MTKTTKRKTGLKHPAPKKALPIEPPKPDQHKPDVRDAALQEAQRELDTVKAALAEKTECWQAQMERASKAENELHVRDEEIQALKEQLQTMKDQLQRQQMRSHEHQRLEAIRVSNHGGGPK
jgi:predicted RNase H-like nuclease (RuvC/YqgF family)